MITQEQQEILKLLDGERQTVVYPGMTRHADKGIIRDISDDGTNCEIVYSSNTDDEIEQVIAQQIQNAKRAGYELEWKVYGHDQPLNLGERLATAGFEVGDREAFMVLAATEAALSPFGANNHDVRRVTDEEGLRDYQIIREEVRGRSCAKEIEQYQAMLENHPNNMSIYVAYVEGELAASGRIYFHEESKFAGLYGGNTREKFRNRGLFTQVVAARIREAISRGVPYITVDALPTSEPILAKRGFQYVTYTQPFTLVS